MTSIYKMEAAQLRAAAEAIRNKIADIRRRAGDGTLERDLAEHIARAFLPLADEFERDAERCLDPDFQDIAHG